MKTKLSVLLAIILSQFSIKTLAADYNFTSDFNSSQKTHSESVEAGSTCNFKMNSMTTDYYVDWYVNNSIFKKQDERTGFPTYSNPNITLTINQYTTIKAEVRHDNDYGLTETHYWYISIKKPDLVVQNQSAIPTTVNSGSTVSASCIVKNQGDAKANFSLFQVSGLRYYLSSNTTYDSSDKELGSSNINDINAGSTQSINGKSLTIPSDTPSGTYYVLFYIDKDNNIDESNESNNVVYYQITVHHPIADLVVQNQSAIPTTVNSGSTVSASCIVKNQGDAKANFSLFQVSGLRYYLSSNTTYDSSDKELGSSNINDINAGSTQSINGKSLTIPSDTPSGTYYVLFYIDKDNNIDESNESNNVVYYQITVHHPIADLVVQNQSAIPTTVNSGSAVSVSCVVKNQGDAKANFSLFQVSGLRYYLSSNTTYDSSDKELGSSNINDINAGSTQSINGKSLTIPSDTPSGTYYVLFYIDKDNNIDESNESNNVVYYQITVHHPIADLVVQNQSAIPTTVNSGSAVSVSCVVKNQGDAKANFSLFQVSGLRYYLSSNTTYDSSDKELGSSNINDINASSTQSISGKSLTIPSDTPSGTYYVLFYIDKDNNIDESNESNNVVYYQITVHQPLPDLFISGYEIPSGQIISGDNFNVSCAVENRGDAKANFSLLQLNGLTYYLSSDMNYDDNDVELGSSNINDIGAGEKQTIWDKSLTIPADTPSGRYYILFYIDQKNDIVESDDSNNIGVGEITVHHPAADLLVNSNSVTPDKVNSGDKISVSCTVENEGDAKANFSLFQLSGLTYYLSSDMNYDDSDIELGSSNINDIDAGSSQSISGKSLTIPSDTPSGTYYVLFYIDKKNDIEESDDSNNIVYYQITVHHPVPDLLVTNYSVTPDKVNSGDKISVSCTVENKGDAKANFSLFQLSGLTYYLSSDMNYDDSDIELGSSNINDIDAGSSQSISGKSLTIPSDTPSGTYYVLFYIDKKNDIEESDDSNNIVYYQITVHHPVPDLLVTNYSVTPDIVNSGDKISVSCTVENEGDAKANFSLLTGDELTFYLSKDTQFDANDDVYLGKYNLQDIDVNSLQTVDSETLTIPGDTKSGTYHILFVVDRDNQIEESNEGNNVSALGINIIEAPTVLTRQPTPIDNTNVILNATINAGNDDTEVEFEFGTSTSYGQTITATPNTVNGTKDIDVSASMEGLQPNQEYHYRVRAANSSGTVFGDDVVFTTAIPVLTTNSVSQITATTAYGGGNITDDMGYVVTESGVCWSTSVDPTVDDSHTSDGSDIGSFESQMENLTPNTEYHVRAYATNAYGTAYGDDVVFTTKGAPTVKTKAISIYTSTTASTGGEITSDGGSLVTARGVCWSTSVDPTIDDSHTSNGSDIGSFESQMENLTPNTEYHVRAYATNAYGTAYGDDVVFTTAGVIAIVQTKAIDNITSTGASSGGDVTDDGGSSVTARGVCWSTSVDPTTDDSHTSDGSGTGSYESQMENLTPNTEYHVRAYATNVYGTAYGDDVVFTTKGAPTVKTKAISIYTSTTASTGGEITSDGGSSVTARGVCWSTSVDPTIDDSHTSNGSGTGSYESQMENLTPNTEYHVRAYATNAYGTAYGDDVVFTTAGVIAIVQTKAIDNITSTGASSGGDVTDDGGSSVTARGVCWSTSVDPTIDDSHTSDGSGTGSYESQMENMTPNTEYHVRAYAANAYGTAYGDDNVFTTKEVEIVTPQVTVEDATSITDSSAVLNGSVNALGIETNVEFEFGTTIDYGYSIVCSPETVSGSDVIEVQASITGLRPNTIYHYRIKAINNQTTVTSSDKMFTSMITGAIDYSAQKLKIYPNPCKGILKIDLPSEKNERITISIVNTTGSLVFEKRFDLIEYPHQVSLNLENVADGIYIINIHGNSINQSEKIILQK